MYDFPETKCSFIFEVILGTKVPQMANINNRLLFSRAASPNFSYNFATNIKKKNLIYEFPDKTCIFELCIKVKLRSALMQIHQR